MPFRLQYLAHDLELQPGRFTIGRSLECQLALDDPMVSRRHAQIRVEEGRAVLVDLGSRNGVALNGRPITGEVVLNDGDEVSIGSQKMLIRVAEEVPEERPSRPSREGHRATTGSIDVSEIQAASVPTSVGQTMVPVSSVPRLTNALRHLTGVADKALALGRGDEAERILGSILHQLLDEAQQGQVISPDLAETVGLYALRIGKSTGRSEWVTFVFDLGTRLRWVFPASIVDELHGVLRKTKRPDMGRVRGYLDVVRARAARASPAERFLIQRIESLVELAASR